MSTFARALGIAALSWAMIAFLGCAWLASHGEEAGSAVTSIGTVIGGGNPILGLALGAAGALLTGLGEVSKRKQGR